MTKITLILVLASLSFSLPLSATVIQFSAASAANGDRQVVLADGVTLASTSNYEVFAGTFSNPGNFTFSSSLSVQQNFNNMFVAGPTGPGFSQFGLAQPGNGASESTGSLILTTTGVLPHSQIAAGSPALTDENAGASFFDGKQIYIVIVNGTTVAAASQMGIFTSTSWLVTNHNDGSGVNDINTFFTSTSSAPSVTALGNAGQVNSSPNQLQLAAPEPSTLMSLIGAGGLVGMLRRRRATK